MNERLRQYYERKAISQSMIKSLWNGESFYEKENPYYYKEEPHFIIGDAVDCQITRPEDFDKEFYLSEYESKPGKGSLAIGYYVWDNLAEDRRERIIENVMPFFQHVVDEGEFPNWEQVDNVEAEYVSVIESLLKEAFEMHNYGGGSWSPLRQVKTSMKSILPYWEDLVKAKGRQIISQKELETVEMIVDKFKNHPHVSFVFDHRLEVTYQKEINWERDGVPCKGLLDMVIENSSGSDITLTNGLILKAGQKAIVDFKTTNSPAFKCKSAIKRYRYDVQMAWYLEGLQAQDMDFDFASEDIKCLLLFVSTIEKDTPVAYEFSPTELSIARWGAMRVGINEYVPYIDTYKDIEPPINYMNVDLVGYEGMFDLACLHVQHDVWDMPLDVYLNKGIIRNILWV